MSEAEPLLLDLKPVLILLELASLSDSDPDPLSDENLVEPLLLVTLRYAARAHCGTFPVGIPTGKYTKKIT